MRIALVHDCLREYGGAERVVETLHEIWPEAPLYTSFVDWDALGSQGYRFREWDIRTSPIADNWIIRKFHSPLRFLAPKIWESLDLSGYDLVISSSGWFICRGAANRQPITDNQQLHICYIHHPPRNLYGYATGSSLQKYWPVRAYATVVNFFLRHYDFETAQKVDYFIANSQETARRVEKFYRRKSTVIYPPVGIMQGVALQRELQGHPLRKREYFICVGRLTYSKRVDLAILAANKLKIPLKIVGTGAEERHLRSLGGPTVEFLGSVSDSELDELYAGAKALIFCALDEDFGIVPVEAMAHGVPVIALAQGGVLETVVHKKTGVLFNEPTVEALVKAIKQCNNMIIRPTLCIAQAKKFSKERFKRELKKFVEEKYGVGS